VEVASFSQHGAKKKEWSIQEIKISITPYMDVNCLTISASPKTGLSLRKRLGLYTIG
jgi:hypothetical protein